MDRKKQERSTCRIDEHGAHSRAMASRMERGLPFCWICDSCKIGVWKKNKSGIPFVAGFTTCDLMFDHSLTNEYHAERTKAKTLGTNPKEKNHGTFLLRCTCFFELSRNASFLGTPFMRGPLRSAQQTQGRHSFIFLGSSRCRIHTLRETREG